MTGKHTVRMSTWNAPGFQIVVAFSAAATAECKSPEDFENARQCMEALRDPKRRRLDRFNAVSAAGHGVLTDDARFDALLGELDSDAAMILLPPPALRWLRTRMLSLPAAGMLVESRKRLEASFSAVVESDVEITP